MRVIGIDCGSATCKGVIIENSIIKAKAILPTGWSPKTTAKEIVSMLTKEVEDYESLKIVATGYGRVGITFADKQVTEITCHAKGAEYLSPGVRTVIDIGGQDSKVIALKNGKVIAFQMNDKCAAGTGRFVEMSAHRMGIDMNDINQFLEADKKCNLSSVCAVFADSEIVSLLAAGKTREEIAGGVVASVVARAIALSAKINVESPILLTGGLSHLNILKESLAEKLECEVKASELSQYAGAIGAALMI